LDYWQRLRGAQKTTGGSRSWPAVGRTPDLENTRIGPGREPAAGLRWGKGGGKLTVDGGDSLRSGLAGRHKEGMVAERPMGKAISGKSSLGATAAGCTAPGHQWPRWRPGRQPGAFTGRKTQHGGQAAVWIQRIPSPGRGGVGEWLQKSFGGEEEVGSRGEDAGGGGGDKHRLVARGGPKAASTRAPIRRVAPPPAQSLPE